MNTSRQIILTLPQTLFLPLALAAILVPALGMAQDGRQLEEVVVTAQKRAESSQDVPVALTVLSSDMLEAAGIDRTSDLVKMVPSLTATGGDNKQNTSFRLRGIGTDVFSVGVELGVAVLIDDVAALQAGQSIFNLVDIERIEVLRGPQSTLFGKSASAGVINVNTKAPADEFEGSIDVSASDDEEYRVLASISGPVTDSVGYRLTANWSDWDGNVDNLTLGKNVNSSESKGLRAKLRWDISDNATATVTAYYSEDESTCCALTWADLDPNARVFGFVPGELAPGIEAADDNFDFRSDDGPEDETENTGANVRFDVDMGEFTLVSITAVDNWQYTNWGDVDFSELDVAAAFTGGALHGGFFSISDIETDLFTQELRLASPAYDNFDYLVGLYYANVDTTRDFLRNPGLPIIPAEWAADAGTESIAVFSHANWRITDNTHLSGGLRWNDETVSVGYRGADGPVFGEDDDSTVLGNITLRHFFDDEVMLYATYSQGYKGQGYNIATGFNQAQADSPVAPEESESLEIGIKSTLLDGRMRLNATAFSTEYDDFQGQSFEVLPDGSTVINLNNVGSVETQGVEVEGTVLVGDNLTLGFGVTFLDAEIKEFPGATCYPGQGEAEGCIGGSQDLAGGELPNAPELKYNLMADLQPAPGRYALRRLRQPVVFVAGRGAVRPATEPRDRARQLRRGQPECRHRGECRCSLPCHRLRQ